VLKCRQLGDVIAIEVKETTLDAECAEQFRELLEAQLEGGPKVLLDLKAVAFADSTGLGAILTCLHRLSRKGGTVRICGLRPLVHEMFRVLRLDRMVDVHPTPEEALLAFGAAGVTT